MSDNFQFKLNNPLQKRLDESKKILSRYEGRIPIIVEIPERSKYDILGTDIGTLEKNKYLVPGDITCGEFFRILRKKIKVSSEKGVFIYVHGPNGSIIPTLNKLISEIYDEYKDPDNFIYISIIGESVFGNKM